MLIFREMKGLREYVAGQKKKSATIGFVPTMGALHQGHESLFLHSLNENAVTIGSIFVNPAQFNNKEDLLKYPRTEEEDLEMLRTIGCHAVFLPSVEEIYPVKPLMTFNFGYLDKIMEGKFRDGHFSGVALVVSKLFNICQPDKAYFGQKDLQQVTIIRQLINELAFPIELVVCPVAREEDGLAMSSRNRRLSQKGRSQAPFIYETLCLAEKLLKETEVDSVCNTVRNLFDQKPEFTLEYFEIADAETLRPVKCVKEHNRIALCVAAWLDGIRLIDNVIIIS
ncbi:pantoate--beta-alanine ligase [Cytophagaceae bacterium ABcell3]|nr:pantoate--beta-alanine ligase [Cytophagaceae bacterium ABcell3]